MLQLQVVRESVFSPWSISVAWAVIAVLFLLKGSIWKLIWREMIGWTVIMALLYVLYVHVLKDTVYEEYYTFLIDLTRDVPTDGTLMFVLSYMTYNSLTRWSDTFKCLAWPENVALMFKQYCNKRAVIKHDQLFTSFLMFSCPNMKRGVCSELWLGTWPSSTSWCSVTCLPTFGTCSQRLMIWFYLGFSPSKVQ